MRLRGVLFAIILLITHLAAQQQTGAVFETAAVKLNRTGDRPNMRMQPGGRIQWTSVTLKDLIRTAHQRGSYDTRDIVGGPDWLAMARFDVIALAGADVPLVDASGFPAPMFAMLRSLLEERFQLRVHNEQREAPVYALTLARANDASRLEPTTLDCADIGRRQAQGALPRNGDGPPPCMAATPRGRITGTGMTSAGLANILGTIVGRPVVDRTGLAGAYDIDLRYRPDDAPADDLPSIFTALEEQLGVKLQPARAPVDVLVVDHAEMPLEN